MNQRAEFRYEGKTRPECEAFINKIKIINYLQSRVPGRITRRGVSHWQRQRAGIQPKGISDLGDPRRT